MCLWIYSCGPTLHYKLIYRDITCIGIENQSFCYPHIRITRGPHKFHHPLKSHISDPMYDNVVLAKALHYLVPPSSSTTGLKITPTMEESQKSFYQFAKDQRDLEDKIESQKNYWLSKEIEPHPIIFGCNFDSRVEYVVVLGQFRFDFDDFLEAFDAAFKLLYFFNIPFPPESFKFWSIINALFYKLSDVPVTQRTFSIIKDLKLHIDQAKKPSRRSGRSSVKRKKLIALFRR